MSRRLAVVSLPVVVIALASFAVVSALGRTTQQPLPPTFGDLNAVQGIELTNQAGEVLLRGTFSTKSDKPKGTEKIADLTSPAGTEAKGKAEIEIGRANGAVVKEEIEVTAERLPGGINCKLMVDGQEAATFTTTNKGKVSLKLSRQMPSAR